MGQVSMHTFFQIGTSFGCFVPPDRRGGWTVRNLSTESGNMDILRTYMHTYLCDRHVYVAAWSCIRFSLPSPTGTLQCQVSNMHVYLLKWSCIQVLDALCHRTAGRGVASSICPVNPEIWTFHGRHTKGGGSRLGVKSVQRKDVQRIVLDLP